MNSGVFSPRTAELNLLLEGPDQRTRPQWVAIFAASVALHLVFFGIGIRIPSLLGDLRPPERTVVVRRIPLYLPRDLMTQKTPNRQKVSKQIDLADLQPSRPAKPSPNRTTPSVRHFEAPKQLAKNLPPQSLPQAPTVSTNVSGGVSPGILGGLPGTVPLAPKASARPFQNIGDSATANAHPKLAPPKATVNAAIDGLANSNSRQLIISDDVPDQRMPGSPGSLDQAPAQHAAVELQSDPAGADFKAYLKNILTIVRANWRRVVPESARMGTLRGRTVVEFAIDRSGNIPKLVMADSSGSEPLDRAAVAGLSMSNPLPPLPGDFKGLQVRLAFTFAYNLPAK